MRIGDRLLSADGTIVLVRRLSNLVTVYETVHNLSVHQLQTYFVIAGQETALVHNCGEGAPLDAIQRAARETLPPQSDAEIVASRAQWLAKYGPKPNQMNQQIYRGAAPRTVTRVDTPKLRLQESNCTFILTAGMRLILTEHGSTADVH